ncbi:MAG: carboxypeptidase regulatory-like domain-containing protein [bacterium]
MRILKRFTPACLAQLAIFLIALTLCSDLLGATGKICGRVFEYGTKKPLAFAKVTVAGTGMSAMTNARGHYTISNAPAGTFMVHAFLAGYQTVMARGVKVVENRVSEICFSLDLSGASARLAFGGEIEFRWRALSDLNLWRERKALITQDLLSHPPRRRMRLK